MMPSITKPAGFTLIELMVALTIGSILIAGAADVFATARRANREADRLAQLNENLHFAMAMLVADIRLAGFWGRTNQSGAIGHLPSARVACGGRDVTAWALKVPDIIETYDNRYVLPCPGNSPRAGSDVIVVRHARPIATAADAQNVQIQSNGEGGTIFRSAQRPASFKLGSEIFDYVANAWYVGDHSAYEPGSPALRRRSLVGATMHDQEIIAGIDRLDVKLGIDSDGDGLVDAYVDAGREPAAGTQARVLAVRLRIEAVSASAESSRRAELTRTVVLRNAHS